MSVEEVVECEDGGSVVSRGHGGSHPWWLLDLNFGADLGCMSTDEELVGSISVRAVENGGAAATGSGWSS